MRCINFNTVGRESGIDFQSIKIITVNLLRVLLLIHKGLLVSGMEGLSPKNQKGNSTQKNYISLATQCNEVERAMIS